MRLIELFIIKESSLSFSLSRPKDLDHDVHWGYEMAERFWRSLSSQKRTWDSKFDTEVRREFSSMVQRLFEEMIFVDYEHIKIKDVRTHGHLKLMRIPPDKLVMRGDFRYGSEDLANVVESGKDLVPIAVGARSEHGPFYVLDGHHRTRGYMIAGKDALCLVGWVDHNGRPAEISFES
jgi:hypothetical protein